MLTSFSTPQFNPAAIFTADASARIPPTGDTLVWISPPTGTASANPGDTVTFLVQLSSARPNVRIDFEANLTPSGGLPTPLPSADVSPSMAFTNINGMAQVSVTVPSNAPLDSTISVTAHTQSVWPTQYLDLISYNSGAQNLMGVSPALNLTASADVSVFKSLQVKAPVTITSNINNAGILSQSSGNYGQSLTTITATPNAGYKFLYWQTTGGVSITSNLASSTTFTTSGVGTVEAFFEQATPVQLDNFQLPQIATQTGFLVPANVTLTNSNQVEETVNVVITANSVTVFTENFNLTAQQTVTEPCYFNPNLLVGNYSATITVTTTSIPGSSAETSTKNLGVTYIGDNSGDFTVNSIDFFNFDDAYIQYYLNGSCNPACDMNHDGKVNDSDFFVFLDAYNAYNIAIYGHPTSP